MTLRHGLFVMNGTAGVTQPQDARLALAALLSGPGLVSGGVVSGNTSGPNMKYDLAGGSFAASRGSAAADGLYLFDNDGTVTVDSATPAPSSGSRWDLIWVRHQNANDGFADANSDPVVGVTVGTAGSTPTKPYSSVPPGALVLAESSVGALITDASHAVISQVAAAAGARLPKAAGSSQYPASPAKGDKVTDLTLGDFVWTGTAWRRAVNDTGWVNITGLASGWSPDSAAPQVRQIGNVVKFQGGIVDSAFSTSSFLSVFNLPAGITPPTGTRVFSIPGPSARMLRVLASGEVDMSAAAASSIAYSLDGISYLTD